MEEKIRHLELIQNVVNRFSKNSFMLKGWSVTLVSALFALAAHNSDIRYIYLAYIPTFVFWGLDGYYLSVERLYRKHYEKVRILDKDKIDFCMSINGLNEKNYPWLSATVSKTLVPFYGALILSMILIMFSKVFGG